MVKNRNVLLKKTLRSIKSNYKQFISIIAISFLAICLFAGLTANYKLLEKRVNKLYTDSNIADIFLLYSDFQEEDEIILSNIEKISTYEKRINISSAIEEDNLTILVADKNNSISVPVVTKGEANFLISEKMAVDLDLEINDTVILEIPNNLNMTQNTLDLLDSYVLNSKENVLKNDTLFIPAVVTGYMLHGEGIENSQFSSAVSYMYQDYFFTTLSSYLTTYYQQVAIDLIENSYDSLITTNQVIIKSNNPTEVVKEIDNIYHAKDNSSLILSTELKNLSSNLAIQQDITQAKKLTYVFPVIFFLVSVLVIMTTLSQMIFKERLEIGTLKAIGVSRRQIINHYAGYGIILCLIGSILGLILGPIIIPNVMNIKYELLWDIPKVPKNIFYLEYLICVAILLILAFAVSYISIHKEVSLLPVESMRPVAPKITKKSFFEKATLFNKEINLTGKMAIRNINRNKAKSLMVVLGVLGCTALLACGFGIMDTLNYGIDYDYTNLIVKDITVTYQLTNTTSHKEELLNVRGVEDVEEVIVFPIKISSNHQEDTTIYLLEDESNFFKVDYSGSGVVMNNELAKSMNVSKGDNLNIIINGKYYQKTIDNIYDSSLTSGIFTKLSNFEGLSLNINQAWVNVTASSNPQTINDEIKQLEYVSKSLTFQDNMDQANELLANIKVMTNVIKVFAVLLAVVVIYNLASLNLKERTRDIATMKVLGFNHTEIAKTLVLEIMLLTIIGSFIGLFFGYPMLVMVMSVNKTKLLNFLYHIYFKTYVISFFISIITALIVNIVLATRTKKIAMIESLKSIE